MLLAIHANAITPASSPTKPCTVQWPASCPRFWIVGRHLRWSVWTSSRVHWSFQSQPASIAVIHSYCSTSSRSWKHAHFPSDRSVVPVKNRWVLVQLIWHNRSVRTTMNWCAITIPPFAYTSLERSCWALSNDVHNLYQRMRPAGVIYL